MKKTEKISSENLGNVSGGVTLDYNKVDMRCISLSQEEYDVLKKAGYIDENDKLATKDLEQAKKCLESNGFFWKSINESTRATGRFFDTEIKIID